MICNCYFYSVNKPISFIKFQTMRLNEKNLACLKVYTDNKENERKPLTVSNQQKDKRNVFK